MENKVWSSPMTPPPQSSGNVDEPSNRDPSSSDRLMNQEFEGSIASTPKTSEQECERGSDGSDSSPNPTSPKRSNMLDKFDSETVTSGTKENILSQPEFPDLAAQHEDSRTTPQKQELEETTAGKHETSEQECENGSDGRDSSPNPTSPKGACMSEKFDDKQIYPDTKANTLSQPEVPNTAAEHEDPQVTSQEQESNESIKLSETGISPGYSKSEPCENDDLNPFGPPKHVEHAQNNTCHIVATNYPNLVHDQLSLLDDYVQLEPVRLPGEEPLVIVDTNDFHLEYFPPEPIIMAIRDSFLTNRLYECSRCEILFKYSDIYRLHMISHRRNSPICGCWFVCACGMHCHENRIEFNAHLLCEVHTYHAYQSEVLIGDDGLPIPIGDERKAYWGTRQVYFCSFCGIMYIHELIHKYHVFNHNTPEHGVYICRQCFVNYEDRTAFNLHLFENAHNMPLD